MASVVSIYLSLISHRWVFGLADYSVKPKSDLFARGIEIEDDIVDYVQTQHSGESGIIYCQ
jgi:hypothetical protein